MIIKEDKDTVEILRKEYGIELYEWEVVFRDKKTVWIVSSDARDVPDIKYQSIGLKIGKYEKHGFRLTMDGALYFGKRIRRRIIEIPSDKLIDFMFGRDVKLSEDVPDGYYVVVCGGDIIGVGKVRKGVLHPYIPKERRYNIKYEKEYEVQPLPETMRKGGEDGKSTKG